MAKIYFVSDLHLGVDARLKSVDREKLFVQWLEEIVAPDADALYLLGDIFEFWFEYKSVVPRGFTRILGALSALRDKGLEIKYYTGNHDLWMKDYFPNELGIPLFHKPEQLCIDNHNFFIGHGDGLGPGDKGYKRMKKVFRNPLAQWAYARLHPNFAFGLAQRISALSRKHTGDSEFQFLGVQNEWLAQYSERKLLHFPETDYFIFGHRHLPIDITLSNQKSKYINTGEWLNFQTYAVWENQKLTLKAYKTEFVCYP